MTSGKAWIAVIGAVLASFISVPAWADACGPLKQVMSLDLDVLPSGLSTVPVTINGSPRKMLFDTGGGISTLTQSAAESLGLHPVSTRAKLLDVRGNASQTYVTLASFVIGSAQANDLMMMIAPQDKIGDTGADGILAGDLMIRYDEEMDYANKKLLYFLPDHCDGHVVHWTSAPVAVIPFRRALAGGRNINDTHIRFHVTMDGKDLSAILDTGASRTLISAKAANADFNVNENTPNTVPLGEMQGRKVVGYVFKAISFGDAGAGSVTVGNPHVTVLPDLIGLHDPNNSHVTNSLIKREDDDLGPDITIGMDVIKQLHIYVATREQNLYISAAGAPAPGQ